MLRVFAVVGASRLFILVGAVALSAACSLALHFGEEGLPCEANGACLQGFVCDAEQRCVRPDGGGPVVPRDGGEDGGGDAGREDGGPDAGPGRPDGSSRFTEPLARERSFHQAVRMPSGQVLITGGISSGEFLATTEIYTPSTDGWTVGPSLPTGGRALFTLSGLPDGRVMAIGGQRGDAGALGSSSEQDATLFDATLGGTQTLKLAQPRSGHTSTVLPDGGILVAGGMPSPRAVERFVQGGFFATLSMNVSRHRHAAVLLQDGHVLVMGGARAGVDAGLTPTVESYNPVTPAWSVKAPLALARSDHNAVTLPGGDVLVVGGRDLDVGPLIGTVERYEPAMDRWVPAGALAQARVGHSTTLLADGRVMVAGGFGPTGILASVELYDPATNSWSAAPPLLKPRTQHTATLLLDGTVLLAGGGTSSVERYTPP